MDPADYIAAIRREGAAVAAAARAGTDATVPSCPGWTVADLVAHLGVAHRWAYENVSTRATELVRGAKHKFGIEPSDPRLSAWFDEGVEQLTSVLESTDADTPVATFAPPATAGFWGRRMAHETLIHRWDAESAHGQPGPFDAELAADGIDEGLNVFVPFVRAGSQVKGSGETFHIHRTDGEGEWLVTVEDSGVRVSREHAKGDVALRGRAEDLLLWLWHRTPPDNLEVFGDPALLDRWFELIPPV